ncbi:3-hydroxyacyl-ACP dehydratase FabZ family protein [Paenibacillus sp. 2TAF8]|uniref:3-hydroxyacyl-ACP dehydratase FabZ family protein n=1 Tax=Paenibacillus sp. 2TAF8 TaxID=3233020 RepID=UPI003F97AC29
MNTGTLLEIIAIYKKGVNQLINIQDILPHRYPFLLIDKVLEVEKNKWAKGYKNVSSNEWYMSEQNTVIPSTLIIEALAQLGAFAVISEENGVGFLSSLKGIEVIGQAFLGDRIDLYYEIIKNKRGFVVGRGVASVGNQVIINAEEIVIYLNLLLSNPKKAKTSDNIIFKLRLLWSLGLLDEFCGSVSADTSSGVHDTTTLSERNLKLENNYRTQ